jgi:cell division protein FtsN
MIKADMMSGRYSRQQRGGTFLGFVAGLVVGLGLALAVAVYVTKVPIPFVNKIGSHSAEKDATEVQKNKDWDPNTPLYGKNPVKPAGPSETVLAPTVPESAASAPVKVAAPTAALASAAARSKPELKPAVTGDPLGELAKERVAAKEAAPTAEPFTYFVQVGAFRTVEDAESQRAKLSLAGIETKISEREQAGRTVYRVRTGPYDNREEADKAKAKLDGLGIDTALVRVQR